MLLEILICICFTLVLLWLNRFSKKYSPAKNQAVLITGCDSGIGFSTAKYCHEIGFTVFAACLNEGSEGCVQLKKLGDVFTVKLDVTSSESIKKALTHVNNVLRANPGISLKTLVNNAGVMVFGEFSWQTEAQIRNQVTINLIGAMNVTNAFMSHIRRNKGRIINICSHCSLEALPGLSVYAASKAGLLAWTNALRVEMKKFQVSVIAFIPGSYPQDTKIFAQHERYVKEMSENMSPEDWNLYKDYFNEYNYYLSFISKPTECRPIENYYFYSILNSALLCVYPKARYCYSPARYFFYHSLFKISPVFIRDWLVLKFVNMPSWKTK
ncbi:D-beta-hydroxybutyrate dehydrogenase, mitochondrial [Planococcus citri]|uniref:D-beta-hydroxybutyrate dehydrogenase, mitochondrial n=1 Tax=Planococcus citri TaxID=170843 RepID=UPI0031F9ED89